MAEMTDDHPHDNAGQKFWAVLLILDAFFLVIFGSALALKIYQYGHEMGEKPVLGKDFKVTRTTKPGAEEPAKTSAPSQTTIAQPAPAQAKPATSEPKPSAPIFAPAQAAKASPAAASSLKAHPIQFTVRASKAKKVRLVGAFLGGKGYKNMAKGPDGRWSIKLYLKSGTYHYYFLVNGKKTLDPNSPKSRGDSVLTLP